MDIKIVILTLAIGSFVFGAILALFQYRKEPALRIPFWVTLSISIHISTVFYVQGHVCER